MLVALQAAGFAEIEVAWRATKHLLHGVAEEVGHVLIYESRPVVDVDHPYPFMGGFNQLLVARFLSAEGRFLAISLAQVAKDGQERDELTIGIREGRDRNANLH